MPPRLPARGAFRNTKVFYVMARRKSIALSAHEDALLRHIYAETNIPTDQFKLRVRQSAKRQFLAEWNRMSGRDDVWEDVIHYMTTKRKNGQWIQLSTGHQKAADPVEETLSPAEWRHLDAAYRAVVLTDGVGSDDLLFDKARASALARDFARRSGRSLDSQTLTSLVMAHRKRGELEKLRPDTDQGDSGLGFGDIDQVA